MTITIPVWALVIAGGLLGAIILGFAVFGAVIWWSLSRPPRGLY